MKSLVTGGAGFIGSHLAEALHREGASVTILDNLELADRRNLTWAGSAICAAREVLGYEPATPFNEGLRQTLDYYRSLAR